MKPRAGATLLSSLTAQAPARVVKRLDASPGAADAWDWQALVVVTDGGEKVTLAPEDGVVRSPEQLSCTCLLAPRCFHILAVAAALEIADTSADTASAASEAAAETAAVSQVAVSEPQRAVGVHALRLLDEWLRQGTSGAGAVLQGELLRVAHEARLEGAHRLAGAALRTVRGARALRGQEPQFTSAALVDDLRELAHAALLLTRRAELNGPELGVARREYSTVGNLRLHGLACEPVIARGGYAGVTSYVCDDHGTVYTLSDILPAEPSRARGAYELGLIMGDTSVSHRELARSGLFVQAATASQDLRLGAGKQVKAVRSTTAATFDDPAPASLFARPLREQLDRAFAAYRSSDELRPKSASLVFVKATILGADDAEVAVSIGGTTLRLSTPDEHPTLPYRDNLRLLGELTGRELLVIAHVLPQRPRTLAPIAIGATRAALTLPEPMGQRLNLGLDELTRAQLVAPQRHGAAVPVEAGVDPLVALRRRLVALALGGVRSLPPEAHGRIDAERTHLTALLMPSAAHCLAALSEACRLTSGRRLSDAFLTATSYERTATLHLQRATFGT